MKFCNKCGNPISSSMKFCNKCGSLIEKKEDTSSNNSLYDDFEKDSSKDNQNSPLIIDDSLQENFKGNLRKNIKKEFKSIKDSKFKKEDFTNPNICKDDFIYPENFYEGKDRNSDFSFHEENNNPKDYSYDKTIYNKKSSFKRKFFVSFFSIMIILSLGFSIYFFKNPLLYKYYYNAATKASSIDEKIYYYNIALNYSKDEKLLNSLCNTLEEDPDFIETSSLLTNLSESEKNDLISKLYVNKATIDFKNKDYYECDSDLDLATKYGYDKKNFSKYDDLQKKIKENTDDLNNYNGDNIYSFTNENPSKFSGNIYDYPYDYIMPYSNCSYLSTSELYKYNKSTLALIRNEIYARHGYVFNTNPYKDYFNSKSWYYPDSSFKGNDSELNSYEIENVKTIKYVENSK